MASPLQSQIYSGGGAVFIGDGNAGRDIINISGQLSSDAAIRR
jgi:hypothetical protein